MESTTDGFKLAELTGNYAARVSCSGTRQSGGTARLGEHMDIKLVQTAQLEARTIHEEDPTLQAPSHISLRKS